MQGNEYAARRWVPMALVALAFASAVGALAVTPLAALAAVFSLAALAAMVTDHRTVGVHRDDRTKAQSAEQGPAPDNRALGLSHLAKDSETGLVTFPVFAALLEAKVATARRRLWPVTVVQIQVEIDASPEQADQPRPESPALAFAALMKVTLREADVCARIGANRFALILEDTDEEGSAWVAERIQVAHVRSRERRVQKISAGVAGYPTNGSTPGELVARSGFALENALMAVNEPGIGRVVVAPTVPYKG